MRLSSYLLVTISALFLWGCIPSDSKNEIVTVTIDETTFSIPRAYFTRLIPPSNTKQRGIGISVMYPEFEALKKPRITYYKEGRQFEDISYVISDASHHIPFEDALVKHKTTFTGHHYAGDMYELEKWTAPPPRLRDNETFVAKENGKAYGYFMCSREDGPAPNPQCSGKFRKFNLAISISFDRDLLKHWPDIRDRSFAMIESFMIQDPIHTESSLPQIRHGKSKSSITQYTIGNNKLCIPREYVKSDVPANDTIRVQTMYPDFLPLEKRPNEYWKEGDWWKQVSFLIAPQRTELSFNETLQPIMEHLKAYEKVGHEYGLVHQTQPDGEIQDFRDLWLEKDDEGNIVSYFTCSEKLTETSVPQCNYNFRHKAFYISMHFNKKLLPSWREINDKTTALLDDFICQTQTSGEPQ